MYTYSAWSVVFGEQPSASKWNIIGTNMAAVDERIGANFSSGTDSPIWWEEIGRTTLGSAGDTISVATIPSRNYLRFIIELIATGGNTNAGVTFNSDTGSNYALRVSINGAADTAVGSQTALNMHPSVGGQLLSLRLEGMNVATQPKLMGYTSYGSQGTTGTNAPHRAEGVGKWGNTANQITSITVTNSSTGDYDIGSNIIVFGHD